MSLARLYSSAVVGVEGIRVTVETHLSSGLPGFAIVGLPETVVRESKERVRSALINSGFEFPAKRITVNLAPAELPKHGGRYDLAIALGILIASGQVKPAQTATPMVLGELTLAGAVNPVRGILPSLVAAQSWQTTAVIPSGNRSELDLVGYSRIHCVTSLAESVARLQGDPLTDTADVPAGAAQGPIRAPPGHSRRPFPQLPDIRGQAVAKRAIQLAAAGGHNLLMLGPPGSGKTMLARCLAHLLPPLSKSEAVEVASVYSVSESAGSRPADLYRAPFRAPHHTTTPAALVGGGSRLNPGEISLAHRGLLFLDEFCEFSPRALEALREPMEAGSITISRANFRISLPARFQLVAAMNPCPCGFAGDPGQRCQCGPESIRRYLGKVSGPMLDRFDLILEVPALSPRELLARDLREPVDADPLAHIARCRIRQRARQGKLNAHLQTPEIERLCTLAPPVQRRLVETLQSLKMSARAMHRVIRLAQTLADFDGVEAIGESQLMEAIGYRRCRMLESVRG